MGLSEIGFQRLVQSGPAKRILYPLGRTACFEAPPRRLYRRLRRSHDAVYPRKGRARDSAEHRGYPQTFDFLISVIQSVALEVSDFMNLEKMVPTLQMEDWRDISAPIRGVDFMLQGLLDLSLVYCGRMLLGALHQYEKYEECLGWGMQIFTCDAWQVCSKSLDMYFSRRHIHIYRKDVFMNFPVQSDSPRPDAEPTIYRFGIDCRIT
nr:hypothetical protein CFP56_70782 [Quercus suber]